MQKVNQQPLPAARSRTPERLQMASSWCSRLLQYVLGRSKPIDNYTCCKLHPGRSQLGGGTQDTEFDKGFTQGRFMYFADTFRAEKLGSVAWMLAPNRYRKVEEKQEKSPAEFPGHDSPTSWSTDNTPWSLNMLFNMI